MYAPQECDFPIWAIASLSHTEMNSICSIARCRTTQETSDFAFEATVAIDAAAGGISCRLDDQGGGYVINLALFAPWCRWRNGFP